MCLMAYKEIFNCTLEHTSKLQDNWNTLSGIVNDKLKEWFETVNLRSYEYSKYVPGLVSFLE